MRKTASFFLGGILLFLLSACSSNSEQQTGNKNVNQTDQTVTETQISASETQIPASEELTSEADETIVNELQIRVEGEDGQNIVFQLNNSPAANTLYEQLPLSISVDNYSHNEKIFYPPDELDTSETPLAVGSAGTLAYYAPWGNVVLFYGECGGAGGLYALGEAVSGTEQIETLSGEIHIEAVDRE